MARLPGLTRKRSKRRDKVKRSAIGAPPGQLVADPDASVTRLTAFGIGDGETKRLEGCTLDEALALRGSCQKLWLDCTGLADISLIRRLGDAFGLHPLALEDVVNTDQRPKCEVFADLAFVVMRMLNPDGDSEQISLFFGEGFVLTFQERPGDSFEPVRARIAKGAPRILAGQADYLAYALIDAVVDGYFPVVDAQTGRLEALEDEIFDDVDAVQVPELHAMRRDMLQLKRWLRPTRDALGVILRIDRPFLREETKTFFADIQDHADQLIDLNETDRDTASGLIDLHMTLSAARTNEVINLLTIISTIFIPLGFLAGLWGMNFNPEISEWNMPLTQSPYGYPVALAVMTGIALGLLAYFKRKRWI
ncbi:magnesium/cobalt transporter CorA [Aurantimonas sp. VKM B-3413]|uniref:magnesium/cobalt transporter CorA n=1 Tax=Aurantimonas sp. VKM B-3413 TaxID=2779401 RepID=UPI001E2DB42F|nr:magnesium/cobalt transporter CorA [Aurantimonas sp. VKM B-3413]MCB8840829.1 magnesium/cobalt transporter CorA [Aurantimonas sp. VKM B-3413]